MRNVTSIKGNRKARTPLNHAKRQDILADKFEGLEGPIDTQHLLISLLLPPAVKKFIEECEKEVEQLCGARYKHGKTNQRWGSQDGSIILGNHHVAVEKLRVRGKDGKEIPLQTYEDFQNPIVLYRARLFGFEGSGSVECPQFLEDEHSRPKLAEIVSGRLCHRQIRTARPDGWLSASRPSPTEPVPGPILWDRQAHDLVARSIPHEFGQDLETQAFPIPFATNPFHLLTIWRGTWIQSRRDSLLLPTPNSVGPLAGHVVPQAWTESETDWQDGHGEADEARPLVFLRDEVPMPNTKCAAAHRSCQKIFSRTICSA